MGPEGQPLRRRYYSPETERDLDADEIVRGYEIAKDKYVVVTDDELERLQPEKSRNIDLRLFVPQDTIPPVHFERGYFLTPADGSEKAYKLLAEAMDKTELAGIATFVMRGKEYLVAIFSDHEILRAETMRFKDELRSAADVGLSEKHKVSPAAVRKFEKLIAGKSKREFSGARLKDEQTEALLKLVKKKQRSSRNVVEVETPEPDSGNVVDLVKILKQSLAGKQAAAGRSR